MENDYPKLVSREAKLIKEHGFAIHFHNGGPTGSCFYHFHDYYEANLYLGNKELNYIAKGTIYPLVRGDIVLCNIFEPHYFQTPESKYYERLSIGVDANYLLRYSTETTNLLALFNPSQKQYPILHLRYDGLERFLEILRLLQTTEQAIDRQLTEEALAHFFFAVLYDEYAKEDESIATVKSNNRYFKIIGELISYIEMHLQEKISLKELSGAVNYSPQYISKLFKEITNYSIVEYIVDKRISLAKKLLREDNLITNIAAQSGFNNYSYFYKAFKRHVKMSPEEYRQLCLSEKNNKEEKI
ncbi:MAG: AraC family transcriptional regulator [Spirochaetia bacterium]|nr:AraC family transcriptional regulator [Spirochaetia bacterium]